MIGSVSVVITCCGHRKNLELTIPCWISQTIPVEVCVVDYNCPDNTAEWLMSEYPAVNAVKVNNGKYFNFSHSKNVGFKASHGDLIAFNDADFVPGPDYLENMIRPMSIGYDLSILKFFYGIDSITYWCGGQFIITRKAFEKLRGFDEVMNGYGYEDIDLYSRANVLGMHINYFGIPGFLPPINKDHFRDSRDVSSKRNKEIMDNRTSADVNPDGFGIINKVLIE